MTVRSKSSSIFERLCEVIPGGVNSPVRSCQSMGQLPLIAERASGDMIYDPDGNGYIDYCGSWGPLICGHAHPAIIGACQRRMELGTTFGVTTEIEEQLARKVVNLIDSIESIRFVSSGTEATMSALRLARGFTGRDLVVKFSGNYHGHSDCFLVEAGSGVATLSPTASSAGIPKGAVADTVSLRYNAIEEVRTFLNVHQVAAVILEPVAANMGLVPASEEFLNMLREETSRTGALLIFDEVISGFRLGLQGAQGLYGIQPDLTCFGKIIGGGFPAAAFGGRRDVMNCLAPLGPVYQAGTLSGNPVAMEAGLATLKMLEVNGFYETLEQKTRLITDPVSHFIKEKGLMCSLVQRGSLFTLFFGKKTVSTWEEVKGLNLDLYAQFFRFLFDRGVYAPPSQHEAWFVSSAHTEEHLIKTSNLILEFLDQSAP